MLNLSTNYFNLKMFVIEICHFIIFKFVNKCLFNNYLYFSRDEDMQSMASLMSVNNNSDIAPLDDFDNEDIPEDVEEVSVKNLDEFLDISAQLDLMTSSLTESELPSTPISGGCCV